MLTKAEKERIEQLEAKGYFEWGLNSEDSEELDKLIGKTRTLKEKQEAHRLSSPSKSG